MMWPLGSLFSLLSLASLAVTLFALVDAALVPQGAYPAAGKQTKPVWLVILGIAAAWQLLGGSFMGLIGLAGLVAAIVYLVDVRPAVRALGGGRTGRRPPQDRPW